jgi:hypothetical protein
LIFPQERALARGVVSLGEGNGDVWKGSGFRVQGTFPPEKLPSKLISVF